MSRESKTLPSLLKSCDKDAPLYRTYTERFQVSDDRQQRMHRMDGHGGQSGRQAASRPPALAMAWCAEGVLIGSVASVVKVPTVGPAGVDAALAQCGVGKVGDAHALAAPVIVSVGYDAGRGLEPAATAARSPGGANTGRESAPDDRAWPQLVCVTLKDARLASMDDACRALCAGDAQARFQVGEIRSAGGRERFERGVARVLEYIAAGDVYQVNLAHRLTATFEGDPRAFMASLVRAGRPRHGAYVEYTDARGVSRVIASASPELFLESTRATLRTRPMKGTRGVGAAREDHDPARELAASAKDRAELAMIVDLMRNDLGRVCELASVRVEAAHTIERHGEASASLLQATATIAGTPRAGLRWSEVLSAMFPGGSVTGAPKIRAMQIIDELEEARRGPYCGSIGIFQPDGTATLNIAIRTACITGERDDTGMFRDATLDWWVGAGIVADSTPEGEWQETLAKAAVLRAALA